MAVTHRCNKEMEIATMAEKLNNIEKTVNNTNSKLETFIAKVDSTYATKEEVKQVREELTKTDNRLWQITKEVVAAGVLAAILAKQYGLL